jgi:predicted metal-dependent phosphoesterase TrpH
MNFPVFRGIEADSNLGDMLVFGYYKDIPEDIPLHELCRYVHEAGGVIFPAHPYRTGEAWALQKVLQTQGLDLDSDWDKISVLKEIDGIEVINGNISRKANQKAQELADRLKLPGIGGSDAHFTEMIAEGATKFKKPLQSDKELVEALKTGNYRAIYLR